jgi:hypothetical protein
MLCSRHRPHRTSEPARPGDRDRRARHTVVVDDTVLPDPGDALRTRGISIRAQRFA